jgi:hypothetical protein
VHIHRGYCVLLGSGYQDDKSEASMFICSLAYHSYSESKVPGQTLRLTNIFLSLLWS